MPANKEKTPFGVVTKPFRLTVCRMPSTNQGTFGLFHMEGLSGVTVEKPWRNNEPFRSCVPDGIYPLRRTLYHRGGYETYEICDVPNRSRILLHRANMARQVEGCVAPGDRFGVLGDDWAVLNSTRTLERMLEILDAKYDPPLELPMEIEFRPRVEIRVSA